MPHPARNSCHDCGKVGMGLKRGTIPVFSRALDFSQFFADGQLRVYNSRMAPFVNTDTVPLPLGRRSCLLWDDVATSGPVIQVDLS